MPKTATKTEKTEKADKEDRGPPKDGALAVLRQNLMALMKAHPTLKNREALSLRTGGEVSERAIGYMLDEVEGNPTIASVERVATCYHLEVWELLLPGLDVAAVIPPVSAREKTLHTRIEESMRQLGVSVYTVPKRKRPRKGDNP